MINQIDNSDCTGCQMCGDICPTHAIDYDKDEGGFWHPIVDSEKCIHCGICISHCPVLSIDNVKQMDEPQIFEAWTKDDDIRYDSSSGGIFYELAAYVIKLGGVVYGAEWSEDYKSVRHIGITDLHDLHRIMGSKYIQSDVVGIYCKVKHDLEQGRWVLFCGTPCQVAGISNYIGNQNDKLILVDLICNSINSPFAFAKYIEEYETIFHAKICGVKMRSKKEGWENYGIELCFENGKSILRNWKIDSWMRGFVEKNLYSRDSCYICKFRKIPRLSADITLGDFWGKRFEENDMEKGVSVVLINSEKGKKLFDFISSNIYYKGTELVDVYRGNKRLFHQPIRTPQRDIVFGCLRTTSFSDAVDQLNGEDVRDIGLVCFESNNYGNRLVNYALYNFLKDLGCSVWQISYSTDKGTKPLFRFAPYPERVKPNYDSLYKLNDLCHCFIVGGDQQFRYEILDYTGYFSLLPFVENKKKKIAFGTSFGNTWADILENNHILQDNVELAFSRFSGLAIREQSGVDFLVNQIGVDAIQVTDPLMIVDLRYLKLLAKLGYREKYDQAFTSAYILDQDDDKTQLISAVASYISEGRQMVINDAGYYTRYAVEDYPRVEDLVAEIFYSRFVITDSFHGLCLAIRFHKPFIVFYKNNTRGNDRIKEMLNRYQLADRLVEKFDLGKVKDILARDINFDFVDQEMKAESEFSRQWLTSMLNTRKEDEKNNKETEVLRNMLCDSKMIISEQEKEIDKLKLRLFFYDFCGNEKTVVVFGTGACYRKNIETINEYVRIDYLCDNDETKWGMRFHGVECISPKELTDKHNVCVLIMIEKKDIKEQILEQLKNQGITQIKWIGSLLAPEKDFVFSIKDREK